MSIEIRLASTADAASIARMAVALTEEISDRIGSPQFDLDLRDTEDRCASLLSEGAYTALLACVDGRPVGFAGMSEGCALYACGRIGTLQEFYVEPAARSAKVGAALLDAVAAHGAVRGWRRIEVCTPPLPAFEGSLRFYARNGFEITGGRKLKRLL